MQKSIRIEQILELCEKEIAVADIGADHGYTSAALLERGLAERVIATDISERSLDKAKSLFERRQLEGRAICRVGDGLTVLCPGEVQGIILSGMGGHLILRILQEGMEVARNCRWLVISPQSNVEIVRGQLQSMGLRIVKEDVAWEEGKYYPLLKLRPGVPERYTTAELYTGKRELMCDQQRFLRHMRHLAERQQEILKKIRSIGAAADDALERLEMYRSACEEE